MQCLMRKSLHWRDTCRSPIEDIYSTSNTNTQLLLLYHLLISSDAHCAELCTCTNRDATMWFVRIRCAIRRFVGIVRSRSVDRALILPQVLINLIFLSITDTFSASHCRLGYLDYERIFRSIQLVLDVNFIILWILLPFVYLIAFLYIPIFILFLVPASLAYDAYRKEKDSHDFLVPIDVITIIFRIVIGIVVGIVVSIPFAVGSIVSGFVIVFFYMGFLIIRTIPCGLVSRAIRYVGKWYVYF